MMLVDVVILKMTSLLEVNVTNGAIVCNDAKMIVHVLDL